MKRNKFTNLLGILTIPLLAVVVFFALAGNYIPLIVIFPFGSLGLFMPDKISTLFFLIGILQLPIYGFFMDKYGEKKSLFWIILSHIFFILLFFIFRTENLF
jgi:MFS family permease